MMFVRYFVAASLLLAWPATAKTALVSSTPAANAIVAKPGRIVLIFSEKLVIKTASAEILMTAMSDMGMMDHSKMSTEDHATMSANGAMKAHEPMRMTGFTSQISKDGKTLTLLMKRALPTGEYKLNWRAAGADAQVSSGSFIFTVK
jgi:copper resistance protein C